MEQREIKFRGLTKINKWVYGYLDYEPLLEKYFIHVVEGNLNEVGKKLEVDPESVGEYTGLKDKNGKEIYEGDIVIANIYTDDDFKLPVYFKRGNFYIDYSDSEADMYTIGEFIDFCGEIVEIIGNVFENPELLKQNK